MTVKAGHCTGCGTLIWRSAIAQKDWGDTKAGQLYLLWPDPASRYAIFRNGENHWMVGIAYCQACLPPLGQDGPFEGKPLIGTEAALERYTDWFQPARREFYQAWLVDQLFLEPGTVESLLAQWDQDRLSYYS